MADNVQRPPVRLYEVRTVHGEAYWAEGDVIESGSGWFTLWCGPLEISLRIPEADIRAVRRADPAELDTEELEDGRRRSRDDSPDEPALTPEALRSHLEAAVYKALVEDPMLTLPKLRDRIVNEVLPVVLPGGGN